MVRGAFEGADGVLTLGVFPYDPEAKIQLDLALFVAFGAVERFRGIPAGSILEAYADALAAVLGQLESESAAFLATRT